MLNNFEVLCKPLLIKYSLLHLYRNYLVLLLLLKGLL